MRTLKIAAAIAALVTVSACGQPPAPGEQVCQREKEATIAQYGFSKSQYESNSWAYGSPCQNCTAEISAVTFTPNTNGSCTVATTP